MEKRLDWADIAKGIGIILVVFAHTLVPSLRNSHNGVKFVWIFIYNFHMPLFFFISGLLFEKNISRYADKPKFILGKARLLMLPYLTFSVFAYAVIIFSAKIPALGSVLSGGGYGQPSFKYAVFGILFYRGHVDQHLWFVYSLFIVFCINILLKGIMKNKYTLLFLLALYVSKAFVNYPAILDYTASDLLFFSLARFMYAGNKSCILKKPLSLAAAAAVFITANIMYSYFYVTEMPSGLIKAALYITRAVCSAAGIVTVCSLSAMLANTSLKRFFAELGRYSYDIYLMHAPFLVSGLMGILLRYLHLSPVLYCAAVTVTGIALPYFISVLVIRRVRVLSLVILGRYTRANVA